MRTLSTLIVPVIFLIASCTPDNPTINSFDDTWRLLVSGPDGIMAINMPNGTIADPSVWKPANPNAPYPIKRIEEFRDRIYLLTDHNEIIVLSNTTLQPVDTITWSTLSGPAIDIAFANATTAYLSLQENGVGIVDLTVGSVTLIIDVLGQPAEIAAIGNQICVAIPENREVKIIDSRTNSVEATLAMPTAYPTYVAGDGMNDVFCVVSMGAGKIAGDDQSKTTPTLTFIDIPSRTITKTVDLTARASEGSEQVPMGVIVNTSEYAYVPVQNALMLASTRSQNRASAAQFESFGQIYYEAARAEIICVRPDGRTINVFDEFAEKLKLTVALTDSINSAIGIAP